MTARTKLGIFCMVLGVLLLAGAVGLIVYNNRQTAQAGASSAEVLHELRTEMTDPTEDTGIYPEEPTEPDAPLPPVELLTAEDLIMTEKTIRGWNYIGYLSVPSLELELPILSQWTYRGLQFAPARYWGSIKGRDLVLVAHNYPTHFGKINTLTESDTVTFTDMDGKVWVYQVVGKDVVEPSAVEEVTSGVYDLTLLTCTYGGQSRVCVYFDLVE